MEIQTPNFRTHTKTKEGMDFLNNRKVFMSQQGDDNDDIVDDDPSGGAASVALSPEAMAALLEFAHEKGCAVGKCH